MKYLCLILLLLVGIPAFGQQSVQGTPNGYPVAVTNTGTGASGIVTTVGASSGSTNFSVGVIGSAVSVNGTTVAPFGAITTLVQGLLVNNICATAVQVTVADGNNVPMVGSETASNGSFSVPSLGNLPLNMGLVGHVFTNGLQISAVGTSNCIKLWTEGKQFILPMFPCLWWLKRRKRRQK